MHHKGHFSTRPAASSRDRNNGTSQHPSTRARTGRPYRRVGNLVADLLVGFLRSNSSNQRANQHTLLES